jgi:UDP-2,3-diacylglucosamine pyrophosphatase LpxH
MQDGVMPETRFRSIWLSDIHLGTRGCKANALVEFLDAHTCDYLYLVGDIIDFWRLRRAPYWPQIRSDVVWKVLAKARAGTIVTFVPGNHDEYLRRFCDFQLGNIFITREAVHRTAAGQLLLILHGDEFDGVTRCHRWIARLGDIAYEHLLVFNRWFNRVGRALGLPYFSLSAYVKWKVKRAMIFAYDFEEAVAREASRRGMDGVVCGHIHRTEMRSIGGTLYCNTGDWVESCTALVEYEDGRLGLLSYASRVNHRSAPAVLHGGVPAPSARGRP